MQGIKIQFLALALFIQLVSNFLHHLTKKNVKTLKWETLEGIPKLVNTEAETLVKKRNWTIRAGFNSIIAKEEVSKTVAKRKGELIIC